ncbi:MAG: helix-turn-helix transcriptional regulator [Gammaproteobacteria bacterium]|nr:helix-turn-helix transcriptional regulator [Gammaproteobacteria bacterium]
MVNYSPQSLDRTFGALADPTRRALLARLGAGEEISVSELSAPFPLSLPAVLKHLKVLENAGLLSRRKRGRVVLCRLCPEPLADAQTWLAAQREFWTTRLDALATVLAEETPCPTPTAPASPSPAATPRRRHGSTRPGRNRR